MKHLAASLALVLLSGVVCAQTPSQVHHSDLRGFTSEQLVVCFDDKNVCGNDDIYQIGDELIRRLPQLSTDKLVACLGDWKICGASNSESDGWAVSEELARRGNPHPLLTRYWSESDQDVRYGIVHAVYHFRSPEVTAFMEKVLDSQDGDEGFLFWPADYLAKQCNSKGLSWLSTRQGRPESCMVFSSTVPLFGKCRYRPAIPYLVEHSIGDACLNIVDAAVTDLRKLFPGSPKIFNNIEDMQSYFCSRAKKEGYKVVCDSK